MTKLNNLKWVLVFPDKVITEVQVASFSQTDTKGATAIGIIDPENPDQDLWASLAGATPVFFRRMEYNVMTNEHRIKYVAFGHDDGEFKTIHWISEDSITTTTNQDIDDLE